MSSEPLPQAVADYQALRIELDTLEAKSGSFEGGETVAMTFDVPKEWVLLAAWIRTKALQQTQRPMPALDLRPGSKDTTRAGDYLIKAMAEAYGRDLDELEKGTHPVLFRRDDAGALDEGIPF